MLNLGVVLQGQVVCLGVRLKKYFEDNKPMTSKEGEFLYVVTVAVLADGDAEVLKVTVTGDVSVRPLQEVMFDGLEVVPWSRDGKSGVAYRAKSVVGVGK